MEEAAYSALFKLGIERGKNFFKSFFKRQPLSVEEVKKRAQILFIDDEAPSLILSQITEAGWNVRSRVDVENLDSEDIKNADVVFVDYKDVGKKLTPTDEGIGLLKLLKRKYPKKHFIFYSGYAGFIPGHEIHDFANGWIQKNADPYVYVERIEAAVLSIYNGTR